MPHRRGTYLLSVTVLADWLIRLEREDSLPRIVVRRLDSGEEHTIAFPEEAYSLGAEAGYEFATDRLRFHYSSMTTPNETWDYDLKTRARTLRKRQEVPSGHDPSAYVTRRLFAQGPRRRDRSDLDPAPQGRQAVDGSAPCLLYGYGAYGYAMPASFATGAALAGRSRLRLCHRACPRRHREGLALVSGRQAAEEDQHVHGLHRGGRTPARARLARARSSRMAARPAGC